MTTRLASLAVAAFAVLLSAGAPSTPPGNSARTEVVVLLESPPLARAPAARAAVEAEQRTFRRELAAQLPEARVGWRYRLVANGFSLSVPSHQLPRLRGLPGVRDVLPASSYEPQLASSPQQIGAPALWGSALDTAGQGVKIGIIDSGVDPEHRFFDPTGYAMPPGFPKGQQRFTTAKVIVARVFAPKSATAPSARVAFSDDDSSHGTHVAGIAAGNADTSTGQGRVSGVAPRAFLGNYKVFVTTGSGLSPNANSPAIVAAIEAAVADGMDVINFSGGEPEIEPSRDIVALALDAAAAAGVVPVVAAGNDYNDLGAGSVSSPANSSRAISVGAVEISGNPVTRTHAEFSSVGPTTISLRLKPDVAAPGVDVLSSVPGNGWSAFSGTSMAAPHVAGAAALLRQRHPEWTVEQLKSALAQSGVDAVDERDRAAGPRVQGGGVVALPRADLPLLFAAPTAISLGLLSRGGDATTTVSLEDAGGGSGTWQVGRVVRNAPAGVKLVLPATVDVPGALAVAVTVTRSSKPGDLDAYVELRRGTDVRRVPVWGRVTVGALARHQLAGLGKPGIYRSTTLRQPAFVFRYRYPENPSGVGVTTTLRGPERVFRAATCEARRELRRRRHPTRKDEPGGAESRRRARREPADRVRGASRQPQPVHGRVPRRRPRGRRAVARARRVRGRLRQRRAGGCGFLHVPVLGERRDPARVAGACAHPCPRRSARRQRHRCRIGRLCGLDPRVDRRLACQGRSSARRHHVPDPKPRRRDASPAPTRLRLPGGEEHRERRAHPSEHAHDHRHVPAFARQARQSPVATTRPRSGRL